DTMPAGVSPPGGFTTRLRADSLGTSRVVDRAARNDMALKARIEIESRGRTFASGLLLDIVAALRETSRGDLVAIVGDDPALGRDLETWSRLTRNPIVAFTSENGRTRWVFRHGDPPGEEEAARPLGERLWLYT